MLIDVEMKDLRNVNKSDFARPALEQVVIHLIIALMIHSLIETEVFLSTFSKRWLGLSNVLTKKSRM